MTKEYVHAIAKTSDSFYVERHIEGYIENDRFVGEFFRMDKFGEKSSAFRDGFIHNVRVTKAPDGVRRMVSFGGGNTSGSQKFIFK